MLREPLIFLCVGRIEHLASSTGKIEGTRWKINIYIIHGNTHHVLQSSEHCLSRSCFSSLTNSILLFNLKVKLYKQVSKISGLGGQEVLI